MGDEQRPREFAVGKILTGHGLKGYVKVKSLSGESEHLLRLKTVHVGSSEKRLPFEVQDVRAAAGLVLVKLAGVDDRNAADELRGQLVWVPRKNASSLGEEEYYAADLVGCRLFQGHNLIGRVLAVPEGGGGDFLEVESPEGKVLIIPFSRHFVGKVDIAAGRIELTEAYEIP